MDDAQRERYRKVFTREMTLTQALDELTASFGWPGYAVPGIATKPTETPKTPPPLGPSQKAVAHATSLSGQAKGADVLARAHDVKKLGLDASVCRQDVYDRVLESAGGGRTATLRVADFKAWLEGKAE